MKLGFFGMPHGVSDFRAGIDACVENGLGYIELFDAWEFDGNLPMQTLLQNAKTFRSYADSKGIQVTCFSVCADLVGENRKEAIARLQKLVAVCETLGCPYLHHTLAPTIDPAAEETPLILERAVEAAREIYDTAAAHGIVCLYEPQGMIFNGAEPLGRFLEVLDRPAGLVADFGNPLFVDQSVQELIVRFSSRIKHVHIKDYLRKEGNAAPDQYWHQTKAGAYLRDTVAGHGVVPIKTLLSMLLQAGYTGNYSLECGGLEHCHPDATRLDLANVKRLYQEAKEDIQI